MSISSSQVLSSLSEGRRETRRNYILHGVEGGIYMGGLSLLAAESVAPAMVASLGGSAFMVALMPMLTQIGLSWPSLFTAHRIEKLPRVMPLVRITGLLQRLPFLLGGLALLSATRNFTQPVLWLVLLVPFISGSFCGISFPAWVELVSKTVSKKRRSSLWAFRNIFGGIMGLAAGALINLVLRHAPGPEGFGILHLCTFGLLTLSYLIFLQIREPFHEHRMRAPTRTLRENLSGVPALLRTDPALRNFTLMRICATGIFIVVPFMALHALEVTGRPEAFLGSLVMAQMAGAIVGNLSAGVLGDRYGGGLPALAGRALLALTCILFLVSHHEFGFLFAFFLFGSGSGMIQVGAMSLSIDICPPDRRPTYIAFLTTLMMPSMLIMAGISALLRHHSNAFTLNALASLFFVLCSAWFNARIREPTAEVEQT